MAKKKKSKLLKSKSFKNLFHNSLSLTLLVLFFVSSILFVLLRMKAVDMGIELSKLNKEFDKVQTQNKELMAKKAELLSPTKLKSLARKYKLKEPKAKQLIVVE